MAEYIERAELMKFPIRIDHYDKEHGNVNFVYGVETVLEYAKNIPAADVAPVVHGRWVAKPTMYRHPNARNYYCSECRYEPTETKEFCPNCGARMDGEGK